MTIKKTSFLFAAITITLLHISTEGFAQDKTADKAKDTMLCMGAYWTETQGKQFLDEIKKTYSTKAAWEKRAKKIRTQILKGTGLNKFPHRNALNPIFGEKRVYDGYQVQNVAFESLPGVYVTGSLYTPLGNQNALPAILSPHGHWAKPDDYGRYRPDA